MRSGVRPNPGVPLRVSALDQLEFRTVWVATSKPPTTTQARGSEASETAVQCKAVRSTNGALPAHRHHSLAASQPATRLTHGAAAPLQVSNVR